MKATPKHSYPKPALPIETEAIEIPLSQGCVALVDTIDGDLLSFKWTALTCRSGLIYAYRKERVNNKEHTVLMHRVILERVTGRPLSRADEVDHINRDGLCNLRGNLRLASHLQNTHNCSMLKNNTSGVKGVFWKKREQKWIARINSDGKEIHLGTFVEFADAVAARRTAEHELWGEFAPTE